MKTNVVKKMMAVMNCLAVMLVAQTANSACIWIFHQPEFPQEAKKFCKQERGTRKVKVKSGCCSK